MSEWESLEAHLFATAERTEEFAKSFGEGCGYNAGLWHDLGKYQPAFQSYIRGETPKGVRHALIGALHAFRKDRQNLLTAAAIAAHHGQLKNVRDLVDDINDGRALPEFPELVAAGRVGKRPEVIPAAIWTRFLFSALVDADSLETERWDTGKDRWRCETDVPQLIAALENHLAALGVRADSPVNSLRRAVQNRCRDVAGLKPGPFRLTVPTGGGKTLASLLFALHHCKTNQLRRVIVVIPYLSIIEQTAGVLKGIFGDDAVLEHHSNLEGDSDDRVNRRAIENWDSPIIVTTSVQFFETLHSNKKRVLRKLHNLAESVVVLDEVQTFPLNLLRPIEDALNSLTDHFRVTTVHCTATQPGLAQPSATEIAPNPGDTFRALPPRVKVFWPHDVDAGITWEELAEKMKKHPAGRVLTIVHSRRDAIELAKAVGPECVHLSTLLCPAHRRKKLESIKALEKCLVVSTQLVEAGVDIDFPVVFRALAGIDSLVQAAGRCNREGVLIRGEFHIYVAPSAPPAGILRKGFEQTRVYLKRGAVPDLFDPSLPAKYFNDLRQFLDTSSVIPGLERTLAFADVAREFEMIPDAGIPVVAPYGQDWWERVKEVRGQPSAKTLRALQPLTVSLPERWLRKIESSGLTPLFPGCDKNTSWTVLKGREGMYSEQFGFGGDGSLSLDTLVI